MNETKRMKWEKKVKKEGKKGREREIGDLENLMLDVRNEYIYITLYIYSMAFFFLVFFFFLGGPLGELAYRVASHRISFLLLL